MLPSPDVWRAALEHSRQYPDHILGPYEALDGTIHMDCVGVDPDEPTCDFDTARVLREDES